MLKLDLAKLACEGKLSFAGALDTEAPEWGDLSPRFEGALSAEGSAESVAGGAILVRVQVRGLWVGECPSCLEGVAEPVREDLSLYFAPDTTEDDGEVRPIPEGVDTLDLEAVLREELVLALPSYVRCRPDCAGLCAGCGASLNDGPCDCPEREMDPRWAALDPNKG